MKLRLLLMSTVVLALGVAVSAASAGEGDPPSPRKQCTKGHWQQWTDATGKQLFHSEDKCLNYVLSGGALPRLPDLALHGGCTVGSGSLSCSFTVSNDGNVPFTGQIGISAHLEASSTTSTGHSASASLGGAGCDAGGPITIFSINNLNGDLFQASCHLTKVGPGPLNISLSGTEAGRPSGSTVTVAFGVSGSGPEISLANNSFNQTYTL